MSKINLEIMFKKVKKKYKDILLTILFLNFSLPILADSDPFEFRGIKLGMTSEEISEQESVKYKFMPSPKKLYCGRGVFKFSKYNNKIYVSQQSQALGPTFSGFNAPKEIERSTDKVQICSGSKMGDVNFKLQGNLVLFSNSVDYKFFDGKLYHLIVKYPFPKNNDGEHLKDAFEKIKVRFDQSKNAEKIKEKLKKTNKKVGSFILQYVSKKDERGAFIRLNYSKKSWKTKFQGLYFFLYDRSMSIEVKKLGKALLDNDIYKYKKSQKTKLKEKKDFKNKSEEL